MTAVPERLSDAALIAAVRRGDTQAYGQLYERHLAAANRAASYLVTTTAEREDLVAEAFTRVLQVLRSGRGPLHDFRPYLLVTMRHAAINAARRSPATSLFAELPDAYLSGATDDPVDARLTGNEAASAFAGLPERWRQVLWHTEVEGESPATIAPLFGMTPNGVAALAYRAREGLRQAYLRLHLPATDRRDCREATDKLAGWVRRSISEPQQRKISAHLNRCPRCRELAAGLTEVNGGLRAMSWLSVLKGALSATTVKFGVAAAIAAVTAIGVVASEPASPDRNPSTASGPVPALPNTPLTTTERSVRTGAEQPEGAVIPDAPRTPAELPAEDAGSDRSTDRSSDSTPESPETAAASGTQGAPEEAGKSAGKPARPEQPARPEPPTHPDPAPVPDNTAHGKK